MSQVRVPLFERLPEIYRARDAEQVPANPLRAYLRAFEAAFGAVHADVAQLYENLFIDTCDDWVIPYLADLVGTTHLKGQPHTLRADVADTIALRRRKGTLAAIERLAYDLTGWMCHGVELRENVAVTRHLNHPRPDLGAMPAAAASAARLDPPRGGTAPIRSPRTLSLLGTAFDPFAYLADTSASRNAAGNDVRNVNLPNLALFLWRLVPYRLSLTRPLLKDVINRGAQPAGIARFVLRFDLHPLNMPVRLFNSGGASGFAESREAGVTLTGPDQVPAPMLAARLTGVLTDPVVANYVAIDSFDDSTGQPAGFDIGDAGLHLFFPARLAVEWQWTTRGANLCAWETGLREPLKVGEIGIDPVIGRIVIGLDTAAQRDALLNSDGTAAVFASFNYGSPGPVGAHPVSRDRLVASDSTLIEVGWTCTVKTLQQALTQLAGATRDCVIEIHDSFVHPVDVDELRLAHSLTIRAASGERPVVLLARPLAFRPETIAPQDAEVPAVRLEGLYLSPDPRSFPAGAALIVQAALSALEIVGCTLSPGGHSLRDGSRAPMQTALRLLNGYGLEGDERRDFVPTPRVLMQKSVAGPVLIDDRYTLSIEQGIVDAGAGVGAVSGAVAIGAASGDANARGAALDFDGLTCFGAVRALRVSGMGGLFPQRVHAFDNQHGCIKASWFGGTGNRLPPNHSCLAAPDARLTFTSERHNDPGYAQVARTSDDRILTLGPGDDTMGAYGFQLEAHKWINLQIRLREFMPVGVRPLLITS